MTRPSNVLTCFRPLQAPAVCDFPHCDQPAAHELEAYTSDPALRPLWVPVCLDHSPYRDYLRLHPEVLEEPDAG